MHADDTRPQAFDIMAALGLLTRPPGPGRSRPRHGARSRRRMGLAARRGVHRGTRGTHGRARLALGLPPPAAAAVTLGVQIALTGAMHETGSPIPPTASGAAGTSPAASPS